MPTINRDRQEFRVASSTGQVAAAFDGVSLLNFHTLSCRGEGSNNTFAGISLTAGFALPPNYQWNPNASTAGQTAQVLAYLLMVLGKGR